VSDLNIVHSAYGIPSEGCVSPSDDEFESRSEGDSVSIFENPGGECHDINVELDYDYHLDVVNAISDTDSSEVVEDEDIPDEEFADRLPNEEDIPDEEFDDNLQNEDHPNRVSKTFI
jgi:hypothetical protein